MEKKALKGNGLKACESCSYWYDDGFCMQHCYYTEGAYYCPKWTDKAIDFDYNPEKAYEFIEEFIQQINHSIMVENQTLITELHNIMKLLNDLYEGIDEYYTETLERNDELAIARADAQLQLIKEIIDEVERI